MTVTRNAWWWVAAGAALTLAVGLVIRLTPPPRKIGLYSSTVGRTASGELQLIAAGEGHLLLEGTRTVRGDGPTVNIAWSKADREREWLASGCVPGARTRFADMSTKALLDLHALTEESGGVVAGGSISWRYVWPRDASLIAVAFARTGHRADAVRLLAFLQSMQSDDGRFQARYLPDGRGVPDDRGVQLDGSGWVVWALNELVQGSPEPERVVIIETFRALLDRSVAAMSSQLSPKSGLPYPSSDYWERGEDEVTLGTVAPLLAGLTSAARLYDLAAASKQAVAVAQVADRLRDAVLGTFGRNGYQRYVDGGGSDSAVAMMLPPFSDSVEPGVLTAFRMARERLRRPAGGLAPGERFRSDGVSWTPSTAIFALAAASTGDRDGATALLSWLDEHRTDLGSLPEKVLPDGAPAAVAPLGWTAAAVLLTLIALDGTMSPSCSRS